MKSLLAVSIIAFSSLTYACPDLSGSYKCHSKPQSDKFAEVAGKISQSINADGVTNYNITIGPMRLKPIKADGLERTTEIKAPGFTLKTIEKSYCEGDMLKTDTTVTSPAMEDLKVVAEVTYQKIDGVLEMEIKSRTGDGSENGMKIICE